MRSIRPLLLLLGISVSFAHAQPQSFSPESAPRFVENRGQWDPEARFLFHSAGFNLWVTNSGAVYDLYRSESDVSGTDPGSEASSGESRHRTGHVVRMKFLGARSDATPFASARQPGVYNYLLGNDPSRWATDVSGYSVVGTSGIYDGIDLKFGLQDGSPRYDLIVQPGADPRQIVMSFDGALGLRVESGGLLEISTSVGTIRQSGLYTYQMVAGTRRSVECSFVSLGDGTVGFAVGEYDRTRPLVIDPLVYATYLGGGNYDRGEGIAVDADGNAYVCGLAESTAFPTTTGAYDQTHNGGFGDIFVTKLNAQGSLLLYSTLIGGSDNDAPLSIAVDTNGNAYVAGYTASSNFPTTATSLDTGYNGSTDAFVLKLNSTGSALVYSTFIGGSKYDVGWGVALDRSGNAYVVGSTLSSGFPTTAGSYDQSYNQGRDVFVTKLNPAGSALVYSTFIGGGSDDYGDAITVDGNGSAYVTGMTASTNYPTTSGTYDGSSNGDWDVYLTKLAADGGSLLYSTYIGGSSSEDASAITVDASGAAYVTGRTLSSDYPVTSGAYDKSYSGLYDVFVTKVFPSGSGLAYSTFLGGGYSDIGTGIAVDDGGSAYVVGTASSLDFPTTADAYSKSRSDTMDLFIAKFDSTGSSLLYSTYLGGDKEEEGGDMALDGNHDIYLTGSSRSSNFPTTSAAFDTSANGNTDAIVLKFKLGKEVPSIELVSPDGGDSLCAGTAYTIRWTSNGVTSVAIDISYNNGASYSLMLVALVQASDGAWVWHIPPAQAPGSTYRIRVRDIKNSLTADSSTTSFRIDPPTAIADITSGVSLCQGDTLRLEATATGAALGYQWQRDGKAIDGATSSTFEIDSVLSSHAGAYTVVVTGRCGAPITSNAAIVDVGVPPEIIDQPSGLAVCSGESAVFHVRASGSGRTYQWRRNGQDIPDAHDSVLTIPSVNADDSGSYEVVLGGTCGTTVVSDSVRLSVDLPLMILAGPPGATLCPGQELTLQVSAVGSSLNYRWRKNGVDLPGASRSTFHLDAVSLADSGLYDVVVSSSCGGADSSFIAVVRVNEPPSIDVQPTPRSVMVGDSVEFAVVVHGSALTYQWRKDGADIPGATDSVYVIQATTLADSGLYDVVVLGACDPSDTSDAATLRVTTTTGVPGASGEGTLAGAALTVVPHPAHGVTRLDLSTSNPPLPLGARMVICDLLGRVVLDLSDHLARNGYESAEFDADALPSGLYFCRLIVSGTTRVVGAVVVEK